MSSDAAPRALTEGVVQQAREAVSSLREELAGLYLPYDLGGAGEALRRRDRVRDQLGDYVLPRLDSADAPLLAVVGGSTGAGKSTLVSSLVRQPVAASSPIRPTTRRPMLLHAPDDAAWFEDGRVLGSLARLRVDPYAPASPPGGHTPRELELRSCVAVPPGLALVDAPDVDSLLEDNRDLAATLLAAADLWVFVTTASRYADAVPWEHLREAAVRQITAAVVLDRVPSGAGEQVETDLRHWLDAAGLGGSPIFSIPETARDAEGLLPCEVVLPVHRWLEALAADEQARRSLARRTVVGALDHALGECDRLRVHLAAQERQHDVLAQAAVVRHREALERVDQITADGSMLRGEVLARWQDLVGTGDLLRSLEGRVGRLRDRVSALLRGRPAAADRVEEAVEFSLTTLLVAESRRAALEVEQDWLRQGCASSQRVRALERLETEEDLELRVAEVVRQWQGDVLALVRSEGADRRVTARLVSLGVNGVGVALMIVVLAHTGGLTGAEVGIAGGTALVAQRLLEAVFGDQALRTMTVRARADLTRHCRELLSARERAFTEVLVPPRPGSGRLRDQVEACRAGATLLLGGRGGGDVTITPDGGDGAVSDEDDDEGDACGRDCGEDRGGSTAPCDVKNREQA
ncbi:dynamin family protein [Actinomyces wuliandei]|uniref:dynamin family protein n=1 Tax=Actinomyces wuliandei TaxID=2057743 RepID=UPI0019D44806|nr:dynamin family protein [Actinomyces wuliandei]